MHHSGATLCLAEQPPETLLAFLQGRSISSEKDHDLVLEAERISEHPRKRRKVVKNGSTKAAASSSDTRDYLNIAKIDFSLVFKKGPSGSYPSPSSNTQNEIDQDQDVLFGLSSGDVKDEYKCRISTMDGESLLDSLLHAEIGQQTMDVLGLAIKSQRSHRQQNHLLKSTCIVSQPIHAEDDTSSNLSQQQTFNLCFRILVPNASDLSDSIGMCGDVLKICAPESIAEPISPWSPRDFYNNVHVPQSSDASPEVLVGEHLRCKLYPFQQRAVQWLLQREEVSKICEAPLENRELHHGFVRTVDGEGTPCLVSQLLGLVTTHESLLLDLDTSPRGGILAEEMGLGKTVEMIALISLHRRDASEKVEAQPRLQRSSATLIITPPAILQQWKKELETLAPCLSVLIYDGLKAETGKSNYTALLSKCISHDVVLTTYNVLAKEIHYAEALSLNLRHDKKYERRLSPLTQTEWWRVVLDEAQMVENGVSHAAKFAKLIPRELAWCVSGTPVKKDARDLYGLLDFLHYRPYCGLRTQIWDSLVTDHRQVFKQIFRRIALRHTKDQIKSELQLPLQKRVVISVPFTQIEEQHYSTLFKEMSEDCGLNIDGAPLAGNWDPESTVVIEKMRNWLTRLRQTCLHPEVGSRNRRALGNGKGPLRTVGEVLEVMIEQNDTALRSEERALLLSQIRRGQILEHAELSEDALKIWLHTLEESKTIVDDCRNHLDTELNRLGLTEDLSSTAEVTEAEGAIATRTGPHRQRLRLAIEIEHMCTFFVANAYYQIKIDEIKTKPESDEFHELERKEVSTYERAKFLRKELLQEIRKRAEAVIERINKKARDQSFVVLPRMPPLEERAGIESRTLIDRLNNLITVMKGQAQQLDEWRKKTMKLLTLPLVDEEDTDLQGDEYETSTKQQDEVYVYVDALRALTTDRHDIVTGQNNELIKHEMNMALKQAQEGKGHSPELLIELLNVRNKLLPTKNTGSIRGLMTEVRELRTTFRGPAERGSSRAVAEMLILNGALSKLHKISTEQIKAVTGLEREIELFKDTMNLRLEYYRQLQHISDTVAPFEEDLEEQARIATLLDKTTLENHLKARIASLKSKGRYLVHLRDEASHAESPKLCIICQQQFEVGLLTSCGHSYCVDCFRMWWNTHRNCPTCKKHLQRNDFHQITYKPQELTMEEETETIEEKEQGIAKRTEDSTIYSGIRDNILSQIKNIDLDGSFGTKIDTLARHLLWIRENDPGAKSIVFSQYRDFLDVLARAFGQFKIGFTSIDRKDGIQKFKDDPSKECFFLHAKAHSSGLTLVNATHVFLCEPLINTAIELQAIARVHRIGQHQTTTVWMYLVEGSVEKSIYEISVARRLAHMGKTASQEREGDEKNMESEIEAANTLELEQAPLANLLSKGSAGGEMIAKDDLWSCLFGQKVGQTGRVSPHAEREVARHLGAAAAEDRLGMHDGAMIDGR